MFVYACLYHPSSLSPFPFFTTVMSALPVSWGPKHLIAHTLSGVLTLGLCSDAVGKQTGSRDCAVCVCVWEKEREREIHTHTYTHFLNDSNTKSTMTTCIIKGTPPKNRRVGKREYGNKRWRRNERKTESSNGELIDVYSNNKVGGKNPRHKLCG